MTDTECRAEQQKFQIETRQQIRKIYALFARGEELSIKAEQRRIAAEKQRTKEAKQRAKEADKRAKEAEQKRIAADTRTKAAEQRRIAADEQRAKEADKRAKEADRLATKRAKIAEASIQEVWATIRATKKRQDEAAKEADKRTKETDRLLKRYAKAAEKRSKELDEKMKEVSEDIHRVNKQSGGTSNNIGSVTEEFFFRAMSAHMRVGTIVFDTIKRNTHYKSEDGTETRELDLVLHNGIFALIIETKYRCHRNDVLDFRDKTSIIKAHAFKEFGAKQLLFGMASEKFNNDAVKYAKQCNMILLYPDGQTIRADTSACTALNQ